MIIDSPMIRLALRGLMCPTGRTRGSVKAMRGWRRERMLTVVIVSVFCTALFAAQAAAAEDWRAVEKSYSRYYPRFMKIALPRVPYRNPMLRVMYLAGGVGMYYGNREDLSTCRIIRQDPRLAEKVAADQFFKSPADYREAREAHVTKAQVVTAYRRGVLFGCSTRRR